MPRNADAEFILTELDVSVVHHKSFVKTHDLDPAVAEGVEVGVELKIEATSHQPLGLALLNAPSFMTRAVSRLRRVLSNAWFLSKAFRTIQRRLVHAPPKFDC